jgi:peptide deformylase
VAVVNVREPIILINPKVIEKWDEIPYYEGCLSFPKQGIHTKRYKNIIVKSADTESSYYFSGVESSQEGKGSWEDDNKQQDQEQRLLEAICVQHELDHLMGMTIHDREDKPKPIVSKKTFGRNEKVEITDGKILSTMKYKKAKPLIDSGLWTIYIGGPIT